MVGRESTRESTVKYEKRNAGPGAVTFLLVLRFFHPSSAQETLALPGGVELAKADDLFSPSKFRPLACSLQAVTFAKIPMQLLHLILVIFKHSSTRLDKLFILFFILHCRLISWKTKLAIDKQFCASLLFIGIISNDELYFL